MQQITFHLLLIAFMRSPSRCTSALSLIALGRVEDGLVDLHELSLGLIEFRWSNVDLDLLLEVAVAYLEGGSALPDKTYTRRQAIADGQLIDVTNLARTVSLTAPSLPMAITDTAWARLRGARQRSPALMQQRTLRVLQAARLAVLGRLSVLGRVPFSVHVGRGAAAFAIEIHESDEGEMVATIMLGHADPQ